MSHETRFALYEACHASPDTLAALDEIALDHIADLIMGAADPLDLDLIDHDVDVDTIVVDGWNSIDTSV